MRSIERAIRNRTARRRWRAALCGLGALSALSSCSVTGLDNASSRFNCNAPRGVPCSSTSGVYANSIAGTLPSTSTTPADAVASEAAQPAAVSRPGTPLHAPEALTLPRRVVPGAGQAIRSMPKQLRVLIFPWVDADNDLHDQAYVYMAVDPGRWLIEHTRAAIRNDAPVPRLAGAPDQAVNDPAPPDTNTRPTPPPVVIPGVMPQRSPRIELPGHSPVNPPVVIPGVTPRVPAPLGIVEQRDE